MARARFIRPEYFTDDKVSLLSMEARLLFPCIWCQCDLRGVFEWNVKILRVVSFPHDQAMTPERIVACLHELTQQRFIMPFEVDGQQWGFVRRFYVYQPCSSGEKKNGTVKPPPPMTKVRPRADSGRTPSLTPSLSESQTQTQAQAQDVKPQALAPVRGARLGGMETPKPPPTKADVDAELRAATDRAMAIQAEREPIQFPAQAQA